MDSSRRIESGLNQKKKEMISEFNMHIDEESCSSDDETAINFSSKDFPQLKIIQENVISTVKLNYQSYYRYITPNQKQKGLMSFYGEDCSFCGGQIFDSTDFIIEFQFAKKTKISSISHHSQSYRGPLRPENIKITGVYYMNPPLDYYCEEFIDQLKSIYNHVLPQTFFYEVQSYPNIQSVKLRQISKKIGPTSQ